MTSYDSLVLVDARVQKLEELEPRQQRGLPLHELPRDQVQARNRQQEPNQ